MKPDFSGNVFWCEMDAGDFTALVNRYAPALVLYARQWCVTPEDVVQAAFLKLARQGTPPENLVPWLYRVVRNGAIDAGRAARRRQKYETHAAERAPSWFLPPDDPTGLDAEAATRALEELPGELREIVVAHLWGGLTFEQIASNLGGSASTAYRRYAEGLELLRKRLNPPAKAKTPQKTNSL
ncbi:MAG: RNA polymerase sigma factor [Fimbriiglobus sp.]